MTTMGLSQPRRVPSCTQVATLYTQSTLCFLTRVSQPKLLNSFMTGVITTYNKASQSANCSHLQFNQAITSTIITNQSPTVGFSLPPRPPL
jgi:hypothetical protein